MSTQQIVERILSDARAEAQAILDDAENKAAKLLADASARANELREQTEESVANKRKSILEKRAADARLDGAKLLLGEKRKVVDAVYDEALSRLLELPKEESLRLIEMLLQEYADEGDEIYFDNHFRYQDEVKVFPVVEKKKLTFSSQTLSLEGGLRLKGKTSDKDLSFGALLKMDREEYQAQLAAKIFK